MIEEFTIARDSNSFRSEPMVIAAVERKLMIISEAAIRLGEDAERYCPGQPWRDIRGIGNWLRHGYERVDIDTIWATVREDLPSLKTAVLQVLADPSAPISG